MRGRALSQLNTRWCAGRSWRSTSSPGSSSAAAERSRSASRTTSSPAHSFGQSRARTGRFACRRARRGCGCTSCSCRGQTRDAGRQNSNFYITPLLSQHWQVSFGQGFSTSRTSGRQNSNFYADKLPFSLFALDRDTELELLHYTSHFKDIRTTELELLHYTSSFSTTSTLTSYRTGIGVHSFYI